MEEIKVRKRSVLRLMIIHFYQAAFFGVPVSLLSIDEIWVDEEVMSEIGVDEI